MKAGIFARFAALAVVLISVSIGSSFSQSRQFGKTIADITVGRDRLDRARSLYGPGALSTAGDVQSLCYYVEADRSYLSVSTFERESRVRSVTLTTIADVTPGCRNAKIEGRHLPAFAGVALGDPMAKVVGAVGQPAETRNLRTGQHDMVRTFYRVAGGRAACIFEQGKLVLISVELD